jgi:plasmid stabilization system protein ParE
MAERRPTAVGSPEALADFDHIWNYYPSVAGKNTAEKIVREIGEVIATIEQHPFAGGSPTWARPRAIGTLAAARLGTSRQKDALRWWQPPATLS